MDVACMIFVLIKENILKKFRPQEKLYLSFVLKVSFKSYAESGLI